MAPSRNNSTMHNRLGRTTFSGGTMKARRIKIARGERVEICLRREKGTKADLCLVGPASVSIVLTKVEKDEKKERRED
jgi:hypothetical protein